MTPQRFRGDPEGFARGYPYGDAMTLRAHGNL